MATLHLSSSDTPSLDAEERDHSPAMSSVPPNASISGISHTGIAVASPIPRGSAEARKVYVTFLNFAICFIMHPCRKKKDKDKKRKRDLEDSDAEHGRLSSLFGLEIK